MLAQLRQAAAADDVSLGRLVRGALSALLGPPVVDRAPPPPPPPPKPTAYRQPTRADFCAAVGVPTSTPDAQIVERAAAVYGSPETRDGMLRALGYSEVRDIRSAVQWLLEDDACVQRQRARHSAAPTRAAKPAAPRPVDPLAGLEDFERAEAAKIKDPTARTRFVVRRHARKARNAATAAKKGRSK